MATTTIKLMPDHPAGRRGRLLALLAAAALLGGCASFTADSGFGAVREGARAQLGQELAWPKDDAERGAVERRVAELLAQPLSAEAAVQVALLNNRGLQASFEELAMADADRVQAGRLPNPRFSMLRASKLHDEGREYSIEQALSFNVLSLLVLPQAQAVERRRFEQVQRMVVLETVNLAAETRQAYFTAVAAEETVRYARQVMQAAEASAELARRMAQAGNWNKLQHAREQGFYADAALGVARAEQAAVAARERLTRLLGLWGQQTGFTLPERLPDLPKAPDELPQVEQAAIAKRLDLQAQRLEIEALARNLGLTRTTRFINVLELGPVRLLEGARDSGYKRGYEIAFELPLFDWGSARVAKAEAIYRQALQRAAEAAINARSEVREAYYGYRSSYDIAKHYRDEILPIRKRIADENLLRYNGMLIGVFELLADARSQIASAGSYIDALRDFWIAKSELDHTLLGKPGPLPVPKAAAAPAAAEPAGH